MKCSQVTRQVFCRFYFQNTADEDYYILEDNAPIEGLRYPYLTISQGDKVIEYRGIHVSRMAPTKDSYVLIEAGKTITSPVVDLTSSYKFYSDGIYTIEYTKPFVYISDAEMSMIDDDKNLPQATGYDDLVASTEIELRDTYYLKPTNYEIRMANKEFEEKTSLGDDTVYVSDGCSQIRFKDVNKLPTKDKLTRQNEVRDLHQKLCDVGYPNAVTDADSNSNKAPYKTFFGSANKNGPLRVLRAVNTAIRNRGKTIEYVFRGSLCEAGEVAYASYNFDQVFFCTGYETLRKHLSKGTVYNDYDSKFQTIAHEYTHAFANTEDIKYGYHQCTWLLSAAKAVNNADSYGYYVQDVYDAATEK